MADSFEEDSYEEEPVILESKIKADVKVLGRNKSPGVNGISIELFQATETESVKILTRRRQHGAGPGAQWLSAHVLLWRQGFTSSDPE